MVAYLNVLGTRLPECVHKGTPNRAQLFLAHTEFGGNFFGIPKKLPFGMVGY